MGRGVCIYVKEVLKGTQWSHLDKNMSRDSVWVEVPLKNKDRLLVGAVYRSPNRDDQRNENLNSLVAKAADQKLSHLLRTRDFNYPDIKRNDGGTCTLKSDHLASKFLETVTDTYLYQHVKDQPEYEEAKSTIYWTSF